MSDKVESEAVQIRRILFRLKAGIIRRVVSSRRADGLNGGGGLLEEAKHGFLKFLFVFFLKKRRCKVPSYLFFL